jgi:hypothetical protein
MKTLLVLFAALFAVSAQADIGPVNRSTNLEVDGTIQPGSEELHYIHVINKSGGTLTAGSLVVWDSSNDDGASVTTSITANALPACVVVGSFPNAASTSCAANALCKCQTYGLAEVKFGVFAGSASAGGPVYISRDRLGYVEATPYSSITISATKIGMFYDAEAATNDEAQVFLNLR